MKKTILEHLQTLPDDHPKYGNIRERAVELCKKDVPYTGDDTERSLLRALSDAFAVPFQDMSYWNEVYDDLEAGTLFDYQKEKNKNECGKCEGSGYKPVFSGNSVLCPECGGDGISSKSPWISVKDRLPEKGEEGHTVLAGYYDGDYFKREIVNTSIFKHNGIIYTHWLPKSFIPEPPKE